MLGYSNLLDCYGKCQKFVTNFHTIRAEKWNKVRILACLSELRFRFGFLDTSSRKHVSDYIRLRNLSYSLKYELEHA